MKTPKRVSTSHKLISEVQLARLQLAKAQSQLNSAKQQARLAKRRRKEAKQAARRARKQVKLAKAELGEAKQALAEAEKNLARTSRQKARIGKSANARRTAKEPAGNPGKKAEPIRRLRKVLSAARAASATATIRSVPASSAVEPKSLPGGDGSGQAIAP